MISDLEFQLHNAHDLLLEITTEQTSNKDLGNILLILPEMHFITEKITLFSA